MKIDNRRVSGDKFLEHRTTERYQIVNDYNHPFYNKEINPLFWPFRALCKYLLELADPTLLFDSDDEP